MLSTFRAYNEGKLQILNITNNYAIVQTVAHKEIDYISLTLELLFHSILMGKLHKCYSKKQKIHFKEQRFKAFLQTFWVYASETTPRYSQARFPLSHMNSAFKRHEIVNEQADNTPCCSVI